MENSYDTIIQENAPVRRLDGADSPDREPKYENTGEEREQLLSEVQVHSSAEGERDSPDYMEIRSADQHDSSSSSSSSSSSDDEESKAEEAAVVAEEEVNIEVEVPVVVVEEVSSEANGSSRRSSVSSRSSSSHGDPCDDPPIQQEIQDESNSEDEMVYTLKQEESLLQTLENVTLDEPSVHVFVKVRNRSVEVSGGLTYSRYQFASLNF